MLVLMNPKKKNARNICNIKAVFGVSCWSHNLWWKIILLFFSEYEFIQSIILHKTLYDVLLAYWKHTIVRHTCHSIIDCHCFIRKLIDCYLLPLTDICNYNFCITTHQHWEWMFILCFLIEMRSVNNFYNIEMFSWKY